MGPMLWTGSSAMSRRRTSSINIRNFIGTTSLRTSRPLSITSMLPRVGVGGLRASTAMYFVLSVSYAIRGHSRDAAHVRYWPHRDVSLRRTDWVAIGGIADMNG